MTDSADDLRSRLGLDGRGRWRRLLSVVIISSILAGVGIWLYQRNSQPPPAPTYRTVEADTGAIAMKVMATGSLQPVRTVEVGVEISGQVTEVAADANDQVTVGQVLVRLDTELLASQLEQVEAQLGAAEGSRQEARATREEARLTLRRSRTLKKRGLAAEQGLEQAQAAYSRARAAYVTAQANERLAQARVVQVQADLAKAVIKAPIDGIVLTRSVELGNTVAASLQTPVLFTIAQDLRQMRLELAVDEADVGQVANGQPAQFTVDAWPSRTFEGTVSSVRFAPTTEQNVVTYEVHVTVANADLLLRPGMTATAQITAKRVDEALRVPNAALRFTPPASMKRDGGGMRGPSLLGGNTNKRRSAGQKAKDRPTGPPGVGVDRRWSTAGDGHDRGHRWQLHPDRRR